MKLTAALAQLTSTPSPEENAGLCAEMVRHAAAAGARLICLPEAANLMQRTHERLRETALSEADDPTLRQCRALAAALGVWIHIGSLILRDGDDFVNRGVLIAADGGVRAVYDKIHMFDAQLAAGEQHRESALFRPGARAVVASSPWGDLGLCICYDLRVPALHRALAHAGARILLNPAAFTRPTGGAHWRPLLRARAIETGCFVLAAAQCGQHGDGRATHGHSLVVSPWGEVMADGGDAPGLTVVTLDLAASETARRQVPALWNDRPFEVQRIGDGAEGQEDQDER